MRGEDDLASPYRHQPHDRFPARAVEHAEAEIERPEAVAVAGGKIEMPFLGPALVGRKVVVDPERRAQPAGAAREGAQAVVGDREQLGRAPVAGEREMGHGLAQLGLLVRMVDQVGLVDDVDQMARFGDAPEHPVDAEAQFPFAAAQRAAQQQIGFAQIAMGAGRVGGVVAEERRQGETGRPGDLEIEFGLGDQPGVIAALAVMGGGLREPAALHRHTPGKLVLGGRGLRPGDDGEKQGRQPDRKPDVAGPRPPECSAACPPNYGGPRHQRTRFRPVRVNSRALRSAPKL